MREVDSFVLQFDSVPVSSVDFCVLLCFSLLLFGPLDGKPHDSRAYHKILYIVVEVRPAIQYPGTWRRFVGMVFLWGSYLFPQRSLCGQHEFLKKAQDGSNASLLHPIPK